MILNTNLILMMISYFAILGLGFFIFFLVSKMGPEGRFFLKANMKKAGAILLLMKQTGEMGFHMVRSKGKSLITGDRQFFFLPSLLGDPEGMEKEINDTITAKSFIAKKPFFMGSSLASVGIPPLLMDRIEKSLNPTHTPALFQTWDISNYLEYVPFMYSDQDIDESFKEGYAEGLTLSEGMNKWLMLMVVALVFAYVLTVFLLLR